MPEETAESLRERAAEEDRKGNALTAAMLRKRAGVGEGASHMIWRLYYKKLGGHVHCRLFCGPQKGALGKCGDLSFRAGEFAEFTRIHRVLGIEFIREMNDDGSPAGDPDVPFDTFERYHGFAP